MFLIFSPHCFPTFPLHFPANVLQEFSFSQVWSSNQQPLHCAFSLERFNVGTSQLSCKISARQVKGHEQILQVYTCVEEVSSFTSYDHYESCVSWIKQNSLHNVFLLIIFRKRRRRSHFLCRPTAQSPPRRALKPLKSLYPFGSASAPPLTLPTPRARTGSSWLRNSTFRGKSLAQAWWA